jgi:hypothetical protein
MKFTMLFSVISLSACSTLNDFRKVTHQEAEVGVQVIEDKKTNVLCYVYRDSDVGSMSCVKK